MAESPSSLADQLGRLLAADGERAHGALSGVVVLDVTRVSAVFDRDLLGGPEAVANMVDAAEFAVADPYRAATHNKGIMNGIDAALIALGQDWRAIEAGAHAFAARSGRYTAMSRFETTYDGHLVGTLELPMPVGLVGGATKVHPAARANVAILGVGSAAELARIILAVGLAQNAGALRALATEGIQRGHMSLHARNVAVSAGAQPLEVDDVVRRMVAERAIRGEVAEQILTELRRG